MDILAALRAIAGESHVLTGTDLAGFDRDWSGALRWSPLCLVRPGSTAEVSSILSSTYAAGIPVVPVAGNTSVTGATYGEGAVMLSLQRMNTIEDINPRAKTATVQSGLVVATLHEALDDHGLVFPLLFGAQGTAQIGGALSTNAGGSNVLRYGNVRALCQGVEAVLPDGRVMNLMSALHKDNTGYDLKDLLIGAEGTLGIITRAVLKLVSKPAAYHTAMLAFETVEDALDVLATLQDISGNAVEAFEYMPDIYIDRHLQRIKGARAPFEDRYPVNVLAHIAQGGENDHSLAERIETALGDHLNSGVLMDAVIAKSLAEARDMWARRDLAAELTLFDPPVVNSDIAVPTDAVSTFLTRAGTAMAKIDPDGVPIWVAHLGDGNIHYTVKISNPDLYDPVSEAIEDIVQDLGGSFSAEHGIGYVKRESMARRKDPVALDVMRGIKTSIDPKGLMNPGKVLP